METAAVRQSGDHLLSYVRHRFQATRLELYNTIYFVPFGTTCCPGFRVLRDFVCGTKWIDKLANAFTVRPSNVDEDL